jgi:DNase/tRNase domain of colicin-like bacteriocin
VLSRSGNDEGDDLPIPDTSAGLAGAAIMTGIINVAEGVATEGEEPVAEAEPAARFKAKKNAGLAGKNHPVTNIPFDMNGNAIFDSVSAGDMELDHFRNHRTDARRATKKFIEKYGKSLPIDKAYVWHHVPGGRVMQLVPKDIHDATGHDGV